ncbi:MAG: TlpA family protein disulfide reductase [Bacteroidales bacterium]|nr:TlpA family protein disulfide reductase [Bacteroidales bacterium]MCL2133391.1 TlpA family protein disulfide reductase [Bacteroidales bacterium]
MKTAILALLFMMSSFEFSVQNTAIPAIMLKDVNGKSYNLNRLNSAENPVVLSFWATWCSPCVQELDALKEVYPDWKAETGVEIIAVSIDDARTAKRVKPLVNGKGWDFVILLDENQDLKRKMNVANPPHTFVVYKGKVVCQQTNYTPGAENKLYEKIKEALTK